MLTSPQCQHLETIYARLTQSQRMYQAEQTEQAQALLQLSIVDTLLLVTELVNQIENKLAVLDHKLDPKRAAKPVEPRPQKREA